MQHLPVKQRKEIDLGSVNGPVKVREEADEQSFCGMALAET